MTFLAEWGDRSQIATIILGAREDPVGVCIGGVLGHSVCTFIAVMGGRMIAQRISIRTGQSTNGWWGIFVKRVCVYVFACGGFFLSPFLFCVLVTRNPLFFI